MSGIEVAGLVLGAYPILTDLCSRYKDVFDGLEGWRAFRERFGDFALSLETESIYYSDTLKSLLCMEPDPFVSSLEEANRIVNSDDQSIWQSEELEAHLRHRLDERYNACALTIGRLNDVMTELYRLLDLERGQTSLPENPGTSWWQEKLDRTRFSFSTKRVRKLAQLKALNEDLGRLVRNSEQLGKLRTSAAPNTLVSFFKRVRENANGLYDVVRGAWTCNCSSTHTIRLRLEKRADGKETPFLLRYHEHDSQDRNIKVEISNTTKNNTVAKDANANGRTVSFGGANMTHPKKSPNVTTVEPPRIAAAVAKDRTKASKTAGRTSKSISFSSLFRKKPANETKPTPASSSSSKALPKFDPKAPTAPKGEGHLVHDLCLTLHSPWQPTHYLQDTYREYRFIDIQPANPAKAATLRTLLDQKTLTKRQRVKLASVLSSSLLQLEQTSWLENGWSKDEIWLLPREDGTMILDCPFITRSFFSSKAKHRSLNVSQSTGATPFQTPLIQFGILLLELCFGDTLEAFMTRKKYATSQDKHQLEIMEYGAALEWSTEVQDEFPDFQTPVDRCLKQSFGERVDWNSLGFLQMLYMNLVKPLSETVTRNNWDRG